MSERYDQVVVGAGMSGLAHAWWCAQRGERVLLLEASDRVGGVIGTSHTNGYRHERAATSIPSSASHLLTLLESLPDTPALVGSEDAAKKQFILRRQGLQAVPRSPPTLVTSPLLPLRSKLRIFGELLRGPRRVTGGESLHTFVRRRFGIGVAEAFLRPFTSGIYGASPNKLGAADAFPKLIAMERRRGSVLKALIAERDPAAGKRQIFLPADGTEAIPRAIAAALGDRVRLGARVAHLSPGGADQPVRLTLDDGTTIEANEVTLAVRAYAQAALIEEAHPHVAERLAAVTYVPIAVASVGFPRDRGPAVPAGFGCLRGHGSKARILGATFNAQLNPAVAPEGCELLTCFLGGSEDPGAIELSDDELRRVVLSDLEVALGGPVDPELFHVWRWERAIPLFAPGHRAAMAEAAAELAEGRLRILGSHVTGVSLDDCCRPQAPLRADLPEGLVRA